jgi:5-methylthioadenosine/S-adenosylhomocysteine deaminase
VVEYAKFPFLDRLLPDAIRRRMDEELLLDRSGLLAFYKSMIDRWNGYADGRLASAVSCSAPQRVTAEYFEALNDLSRTYDLPFYMHILETKLQRVLGEEKFGKSLVRYVHDLGLLKIDP